MIEESNPAILGGVPMRTILNPLLWTGMSKNRHHRVTMGMI